MPSRPESEDNAEQMRQAARQLARSSRTFENPDEMYDVLGSISYTLGALSQSLTQIGTWHEQHTDRAAHDNGDRTAGAADAASVARLLQRSAVALDVALNEVMAAHSTNGRIAWQPAPAPLERSLQDRAASLGTPASEDPDLTLKIGRGPHLI